MQNFQMGLYMERLSRTYCQSAEMFHKVISCSGTFLWLKVLPSFLAELIHQDYAPSLGADSH